ncbi:hypothetical protein FKW77_002516 [Venturia effusa]|uniref:GAT domain-containing protein n=1 Tax=Venturia effusa TaxID=50376 RepID=A0A517LPS0_9PEZI|nr:hypothetical protein FKW77_002516 [Venturia effusa]
MESTTLVTFILNHSNARKIELLGSWDNFSGSYAMTKDSRRGHGIWSGCHTFKDIICDGDSDIHEARSGGLKMGGTYWYFYRIDDDEEYHDPSQPATSTCPLLPGQMLNVLEVPNDTGRYVSRSRSSSVSISSAVQTLNPDDRYLTPRPAPKPKLAKLITSDEAAAAPGHISTSSARDRPWTAVVGQSSDLWDSRTDSRGRGLQYASTSPTNATNVLKSAFMQLKGPITALTPSEGGRGRSRILHPGSVRHHRTKSPSVRELRKNISRPVTTPSQLDHLLESVNESDKTSPAPRDQPLIIRKRAHSPNCRASRIQETNCLLKIATGSIPGENMASDRGRSVSHKEIGRPAGSSHRRGYSDDFAMRRSASVNHKRAPSLLRNIVISQDECRVADAGQIPPGIPELESEDLVATFKFPSKEPQAGQHSRNSSVNTDKELPPLPEFLMPKPLFFLSDSAGLRAASESSMSQHEHEHTPYPKNFEVPLPDSPSSAELQSDTEAQSPTFSSIRGGNSRSSTPHRLSDPPEWPLRNEDASFSLNRSIEKLSTHVRTLSTTSTAMYSLPVGCDGNPFMTDKSHEAEPEMRKMLQGEEVLHLPTIVEAAESSPQAALVAAKEIRKFLSKENNDRPHVQYNAIMLIRILADNPGATFTRNLDGKFTSTVKELLRNGRDPSVQQILRETLAALYTDKAYDTNLTTLFAMWNKEQGATSPRPQNGASAWPVAANFSNSNYNHNQQSSRSQHEPQHFPGQENYGRNQRERGLPPLAELVARIEEAKTSAKLLQQLVQSTPPNEIQDNDLIKEFSERCQTAQRSVQGYINSTDPPPDDDTMQTLIETSEQLSLAASKHQRAILQARRAVASASPPAQTAYAPPTMGPSMGMEPNTGYSSPTSPPSATFTPNAAPYLSDYSPPPVPPPSMRANLERRQSDYEVPPSLRVGNSPSPPAMSPPSTKAPQIHPPVTTAPLELPAPQYDNPFSDRHESRPQPAASAYSTSDNPRPLSRITEPYSPSNPSHHSDYDEYDDPYRAPAPAQSTMASVGTRPAPRQQSTVENWRREIDTSSPPRREGESYHPGYQSTPSYMQRQESAEAHLTMHGGAVPPTPTPGLDELEKELDDLHRMKLSPVAEVRSPSDSMGPAEKARAAVRHAQRGSDARESDDDAGGSDAAISPVYPDRHSGEISPVSTAPTGYGLPSGEGRYGSAGSPGRYSSAYDGMVGDARGKDKALSSFS